MDLLITLNAKEEGDIGGWVNFYKANPSAAVMRLVLDDRTPARVAQITKQFEAHWGPAPVPTPTDPLAAIIDRATRLGNWASWRFATDEEGAAVTFIYGPLVVAQLQNFYKPGGTGGISVNGSVRPDGTAFFFKLVNGVEVSTDDVNGAADAYIAQVAAEQGRTVPRSPI